MAKSDEQDFTHISENISLKGDISGNSNVRVAGKIIGSVSIQGDLVIEKNGYIEGEVQARNAVIAGKIQGNISCLEKLTLEQFSVMIGNIKTKQLSIENGALFQGNCSMEERSKAKPTV